MAMLCPVGRLSAISFRLSAIGNRLSASFRKYKRKQLSGKPSGISCVQTPAKAPARSGLGLALGAIAIVLSALNIHLQAQDSIKPLKIGDAIPEYLWHMPLQVVNHPEGKETITLAEYKGKLIILDFWATWCSSCIAAMPRIHELEKEHGGDMVVIPVTYEASDKAGTFLSTNKTVQPLDMYSVVSDETLRATFPHRGIPHYAWISTSGDVGAVTTSERVNVQNVKLMLDGEMREIQMKIEIDPERPLFLSEVIEMGDLTHYSVFTKKKYDGLGAGTRFRTEKDTLRGRAFTNSNILDMYKATAYPLFEKIGDRFNSKRLIVNVEDKSGLAFQKSPLDGGTTHNVYNYELIVPLVMADSLYDYILKDLNRYTKYHGRIEKRYVKCLTLIKIGDLSSIKTKGGKAENSLFYNRPSRLTNYPMSYLVNRLEQCKEILLPIVDETKHEENVNLEFSGVLDLETLKKELNEQNLDLVEGYRLLNMFIIEDRPI